MQALKLSRRTARLVLVGFVVMLVATAAVAYSAAIQTSTPVHADDVTNVDVLKQQIKNYYGDPEGTGTFSPDSNYAHEAEQVANAGATSLYQFGKLAIRHRAIILDVDDTSLATWNYEIFSNWAYSFSTNNDYVTQQLFPAVPGMVDMAWKAKQLGYAIFWITGRGSAQHAATLGNLGHDGIGVDAGFPAPTRINGTEDGLFTKPALADYPAYLTAACGGSACSTTAYKSATRQHIESEGYHIVANFGDQYSDLNGGFSDRTFKMPNPNYFLP